MTINIAGLDKARVLIALYERARVQGMGALHAKKERMTETEAEALLKGAGDERFDYLHGRVMKIRIAGDDIDERLYDRDNGPGAAAAAIDAIR